MTDTTTEAHRMACEVRLLLSWPVEDLRAYLADLPKWRGEAATKALRAALAAEWKRRRLESAGSRS